MLLIYIFWLIVGFLIYSNFQIELSNLLLYNLHLKKFFNVPDLYAAVGYTLLQSIHSMTLKAVIALRTIDETISLVYWFKCNSRSMYAQISWFSDTPPSCTLLNNRMTSKSNRCTFLPWPFPSPLRRAYFKGGPKRRVKKLKRAKLFERS